MNRPAAQGWYRDPYGLHQDRHFSAGEATKLVRDGGREAYDPPPGQPLPSGDLIPADEGGDMTQDGSALRRADDTSSRPYDPAEARRAVVDSLDVWGHGI